MVSTKDMNPTTRLQRYQFVIEHYVALGINFTLTENSLDVRSSRVGNTRT